MYFEIIFSKIAQRRVAINKQLLESFETQAEIEKIMTPFYFSLHQGIYAARYGQAIIVLDSNKDKYISLVEKAAAYFEMVCQNEFVYEQNIYKAAFPIKDCDEKQLNYWIKEFTQKGFISQSYSKNRKSIAEASLRKGGLSDYKWDFKSSWKPFSQISKWEIAKAFFQLVKVRRLIKKGGLSVLLDLVEKTSHVSIQVPTKEKLNELAAAVDAATILYPKKTYCLAWATTFVLLALKKRWKCYLVIGIQTNPFYAHAWAECADEVINDDPSVAEVLSIILKKP